MVPPFSAVKYTCRPSARPARRVRLEIPRRGEIDGRAAAFGLGHTDQIVGAAVRQLLLDDHVGAERPLGEQELAVGRIRQRAPHVAVVGEPRHRALCGHGVDVGAARSAARSPVLVGGERDRDAVGMPRHVRGRMPSVVIVARAAPSSGGHRDLGGRPQARIRRRIVLAVRLETHPVEGAALESRRMTLLEIGAGDFGRRRARQVFRVRDPFAVGADHARRGRCGTATGVAFGASIAILNRAGGFAAWRAAASPRRRTRRC